MPLRGALFTKIQQLRKKRAQTEKDRFKNEIIAEAKALKRLRKVRIKEEGRAILVSQIEKEKQRIRKARGVRKPGRIESFLAGKVRKGVSAAEREARKQTKEILAQKGSRKKRKGKKRKKKKPSGLFDF